MQKTARGRTARIMSLLTLRCKQTGGKLTWGDLDKILQNQGVENDTEEIDEILSLCEREGIELVNEENDLDDVDTTTENINTESSPETSPALSTRPTYFPSMT